MRKKLATKICAIAMTAAMVATAAGCGNDDSTQGSGSSSESSSEESSSEESTGGADESSEESSAEGDEEANAEEETYDFGGQVVKVNGNIWDNLKEPVPNDAGEVDTTNYDKYWGFAHQIEEKYNIKFEWVELTGDDGYSAGEKIVQTILDGQCFADILAVSECFILDDGQC